MNSNTGTRCLFLFVLIPLLTGCWNMKEVEHMFYAHGVGVEYKNGEYHLYVQVIDFSTLAKAEGGGRSSETGTGAWVGKGTGKTLYSAAHDLYASSQRQIFWGHLNTVILSEELLQGKYLDVLDILTRFGEFRYTPWLFATQNNVEDILLASPILERSPVYSQLSDPHDVYKQSSIIPPIRLHQFLARLPEPASTTVLPCIGTSKDKWKDEKQKYTALEVRGAFFLEKKRTKGRLEKNQLMGLRWMNSSTRRTPLILVNDKGSAASMIFEKIKPQVTPSVQDGRLVFDVNVSAKGSVITMDQFETEEDMRRLAEHIIRREIMDTYKQGLKIKADVYNLLEFAFRKNPEALKLAEESGEFPLNEDSLRSLRIDVRITHTGKNNKSLSETDVEQF